MRLLLILYVLVFLTLNFLIESDLILLLAMTTFPVSLYLLLRKPRSKRKSSTVSLAENEVLTEQNDHHL